ncbi:MAG: MarR family winged helix-turn-helix transcriptional regulator [Alphaproteobacteria bacterium]
MTSPNKLGAFGVLISDAMEGALGGLSPSAAALLLTVHYRSSITITQLAEVAGIAQPTAVRVLDGLARRGWLERQSRIGRTTPLLLTDAGKTQAQSLQAARLRAMGRLLAALPERERITFERALDTMLAAATTSRAFARTTCRLCDHAACVGRLCPIGTRASELEQQP